MSRVIVAEMVFPLARVTLRGGADLKAHFLAGGSVCFRFWLTRSLCLGEGLRADHIYPAPNKSFARCLARLEHASSSEQERDDARRLCAHTSVAWLLPNSCDLSCVRAQVCAQVSAGASVGMQTVQGLDFATI